MRPIRKFLDRKTLFAFALASLIFSSLAGRYFGSYKSADVDFWVYYFAAQVVHDSPHANLYEGATERNPEVFDAPADSSLATHARSAGFSSIQEYVYPPLLADLLVPLSQLPPHVAVTLWRAINLMLVAGSGLLLARMLRVPVLSFEFAVLFVSAFFFFPIVETVSAGQIAIAMFALLTIGVVAYSDGQIILSASALALASALKVTPVLLVPLFFIWKDRRWLIAYLSVSLGLVAAMATFNGTLSVATFLHVVSSMGGGAPIALNKSISAMLAWAYYGKIFDQGSAAAVISNPPRFLSIAAKTVSLLFYSSCLYLVWRSRSKIDRASKATLIAVVYLAILCISPVSWRHGYAAAFIVLAICWASALRIRPRLLHAVLLCLLTVIVGTPFFDAAAKAPLPQVLKIILSASWVIICILFSLETLFHANTESHARGRWSPPGSLTR